MILYFKKYKYTNNGTNWNYNPQTDLSVDENFSELSINIPKRKVNEFDIYGQGSIVIPTYFFENRKISFNYRIKSNNNTIFTNEKDNIFLNWFYSNEEIYLVRNTEKGLQKIKGYFVLDTNEKYKSYSISNDITINFITEDAFFENVSESIFNASMTSNTVDINFTNNGFFTGWYIVYTNQLPFNSLEIIYGDKSFKILQLNETGVRTYILDMRYFKFFRGNIPFFPTFTGKSFYLENGSGVVTFKCDGRGSVSLRFTERFI